MGNDKINPTHEAADAFWAFWRENGETGKHGYYESTWGAINAAIEESGLKHAEMNDGPAHADDEGEWFELGRGLRFIEHPNGRRTLQWAWQGSNGSVAWRDIPVISAREAAKENEENPCNSPT